MHCQCRLGSGERTRLAVLLIQTLLADKDMHGVPTLIAMLHALMVAGSSEPAARRVLDSLLAVRLKALGTRGEEGSWQVVDTALDALGRAAADVKGSSLPAEPDVAHELNLDRCQELLTFLLNNLVRWETRKRNASRTAPVQAGG